jgi:glycosyltransferase involved in cell wall biosynthesis
MYPTHEFPGRGVFVREQINSLISLGLNVRVLFIDRWREGPSAYFRMDDRIARELAEFDPDLIHVMYGGVMAARVVRQCRLRPVCVTFHGSDLLGENLSGWMRKLISRYGVRCSKQAAKTADGVIVVARHLLKALPHTLPAAKVRVFPCGIDLDRFKPMDISSCRRRLRWSSDSFHVLFASSNGDPVKRPWLANAAVCAARARGIPAEMHFLSGVANSEVPVWLNASDVLLLTSLHEGSPTVVKEALACGLPIVSVDVGDVAERIGSIEGCYLAQPDAADLASKLARVQGQPRRLDCQAQLEAISALNIAQRLKAFYEQIVHHQQQATASAPAISAALVRSTP